MHCGVVVDGVDVLSRCHDLDEPGVDRSSELPVEQPGSLEPDVLGLVHHGDDDHDARLFGIAQRVQDLRAERLHQASWTTNYTIVAKAINFTMVC